MRIKITLCQIHSLILILSVYTNKVFCNFFDPVETNYTLLAIEKERDQMMLISNKTKNDLEDCKIQINARKQEITNLASKISYLNDDVSKVKKALSSIGNIPSGLIGYFEKECPIGWEEYIYSKGRFILSAGNFEQRSIDGRLEKFTYTSGQIGGEVFHKLTKSEMPKHNHSDGEFSHLLRSNCDLTNSIGHDRSCGEPDIYNSRVMIDQGNDEPHNNMPPYIVLKACRKK